MKKYFNVNFEFDVSKIHQIVEKHIKENQKGYVCVIDGNVLTHSYKNVEYRDILNNSIVNLCDGSSIALLASKIHGEKLSAYTGPEIFAKFVAMDYRQCFVGNTEENLNKMKAKMQEEGFNTNLFKFIHLPFKEVENFDYVNIANDVNNFKPDIIWISLGAPKQEYFISNLFPHVQQGILFAIGAAFNFFLDEKVDNSDTLKKYNLVWLNRVFKEPKRVGGRALNYLFIIPRLILSELKVKNQK